MKWDLFCHVIDNLGDAGVCWRLSRALAAQHGDRVTLWIDRPEVLDAIAPAASRPAGIRVRAWKPGAAEGARIDPPHAPDIVVEAFGCDLPQEYQRDIAKMHPQPVWINLEYLSAEAYAERQHGLPSPVLSGPAQGMTKWFFHPGFAAGTGGLLLGELPPACAPRDEALIFCYESPVLPEVCEALLEQGIMPVLAAGRGADDLQRNAPALASRVRFAPLMAQTAFDALLADKRINIVRGEDSFARAQLAARPFVWHIYPQDDGAHWPKLEAFFARYRSGLPATAADALWAVWLGFNRGALDRQALRSMLAQLPLLEAHARRWRERLLALGDLSANLRNFARSKLK
jgi:hypothetical protein